mmetsp:Transcript_41181/g.99210  ORF Transcript_41181/g.99210 Transcript_41181/m.99210 type:complete len:316 (-) Transcript_41181:86-1033(-)|eukprot:CAMPEP_0113636602 /NCGR_PEP_ID=MMETSP0017_2-20120614/19112_1 /TAXON_ID=2856 /ORGANISM="Cylindrotheca closterium" /LENGTH=315 /DNA_ID=CAMNT_0000547497 /DNA_START=1066 /DNA_END=2013 /DNA_ORIENTATION=+ /assembly_acc=CAM_ASM_000147
MGGSVSSLDFTSQISAQQAQNVARVCLDNGTGAIMRFSILRNGSECASSGDFTNPYDRCVDISACEGLQDGRTFRVQFSQELGATETLNQDFTYDSSELGATAYFDSGGLAGNIDVWHDKNVYPTASPSMAPTIDVSFEATPVYAADHASACASFDDSSTVERWIQQNGAKVSSITWYFVPANHEHYIPGHLNGFRTRYSNGKGIIHGSERGIDHNGNVPGTPPDSYTLDLDFVNGEYIVEATGYWQRTDVYAQKIMNGLRIATSKGQSYTNPFDYGPSITHDMSSPTEGDALYGWRGVRCDLSALGALYFDPLN